MAGTRVTLKTGGMRQLLQEPGVRAELAGVADRIAAAARAAAPVETGAYQASIVRESVTTDRAVERVTATVDYALEVEARTGNLARAAGAA